MVAVTHSGRETVGSKCGKNAVDDLGPAFRAMEESERCVAEDHSSRYESQSPMKKLGLWDLGIERQYTYTRAP